MVKPNDVLPCGGLANVEAKFVEHLEKKMMRVTLEDLWRVLKTSVLSKGLAMLHLKAGSSTELSSDGCASIWCMEWTKCDTVRVIYRGWHWVKVLTHRECSWG